jgi:hypothetical protein
MINEIIELEKCFDFGRRLNLPCISIINLEDDTWKAGCDSLYPRFPLFHNFQYEALGASNPEALYNLANVLESACSRAGV